jgi:hypothetical protein
MQVRQMDHMSEELNQFCSAYGLDLDSADEMILRLEDSINKASSISELQKLQLGYLHLFVERWDLAAAHDLKDEYEVQVAGISAKFRQVLQKEVGMAELTIADAKNKMPLYKNACATHDYCDSNVYMENAFSHMTGRSPDSGSVYDLTLWDNAWDHARAAGFSKGVK